MLYVHAGLLWNSNYNIQYHAQSTLPLFELVIQRLCCISGLQLIGIFDLDFL